MRALWEAYATLITIATPEEVDLRALWLAGGNLPNVSNAKAIQRQQDRIGETGDSTPPMRDTWQRAFRIFSRDAGSRSDDRRAYDSEVRRRSA